MHLVYIGSHRIDLECGLHDASVKFMFCEVFHQQTAGKKVAQRGIVAHARGVALAAIQHKLLYIVGPQRHHHLLEGEASLGNVPVVFVPVVQGLERIHDKFEGITQQRGAVVAGDMPQLAVVAMPSVLGDGKFHEGYSGLIGAID